MRKWQIKGYQIDCAGCGIWSPGGVPQEFIEIIDSDTPPTLYNSAHKYCGNCPSQRSTANNTDWYPGAVTITEIVEPDKYDCVNGQCVKKTVYNTPGIFSKLEDCESVCGNSEKCDGTCIKTEDWNEIVRLSGTITRC